MLINNDLLIQHADDMQYALQRIQSLGRETCGNCYRDIGKPRQEIVEEFAYGFYTFYCNQECYHEKKHARNMRRVHELIRLRGRERCYREECGNVITNLNECVSDTDFGCGPRDAYTVYYCSKECCYLGH